MQALKLASAATQGYIEIRLANKTPLDGNRRLDIWGCVMLISELREELDGAVCLVIEKKRKLKNNEKQILGWHHLH